MKPNLSHFSVATLVVALMLSTGCAWAQGENTTSVAIQPFFESVIQPIMMAAATAAATVITAAAAYAVAWLRKKASLSDQEAKKLGLEVDEKRRAALHAAITNAASLALNRLGNKLDNQSIDLKSPIMVAAVDYVVRSAPDALAHFNLKGRTDEIAEKIIAKLPQVANTTVPPA